MRDKFVETLKNVDHWKWEAVSSMEIRFMPSLARNINQVGFILNLESEKRAKENLTAEEVEAIFAKRLSGEMLSIPEKRKFETEFDVYV